MMSDTQPQTVAKRISDRSDVILLVGFIAAMAFVLVRSREMGVGTITQPGPGLWPAIVSTATIAACVATLLAKRQAPDQFTGSGTLRVAIFVASALVFTPIYNIIGFLPAGAVTTFLLMTFVYQSTWRATLIVACAAPPLVYLIFGIALGVPLTAFG